MFVAMAFPILLHFIHDYIPVFRLIMTGLARLYVLLKFILATAKDAFGAMVLRYLLNTWVLRYLILEC